MKNTFCIILLCIISFTSCRVVNKLFKKGKVKSDSTAVIREKTDSIASIDTFSIKKSFSDSEEQIVFDFGDKQIYVPMPNDTNGYDKGVYVWPANPDDYFEITKEGTVRTNMPLKSVSVKGKKTNLNIDSSGKKQEVQLNKETEKKVQVKTESKTVDKKVSKKSFLSLWWLLLLIPIYLIIRNRKKIWRWVIFKTTGV